MDAANTLRILEEAGGDPARLTLAAVDLVFTEHDAAVRDDVREALLTASVPHWFDERILASLLEERLRSRSAELVGHLRSLKFIQPIPARGPEALCVHQTNRQSLRALWLATDEQRFHECTRRAAAVFTGAEPHVQIEAHYHRFAFEPVVAAESCWSMSDGWMKAGQTESRLALASVLDELADTLPHGLARAYALIDSAGIRYDRQELSHTLLRVEGALVEARNAGVGWLQLEAHALLGNVKRAMGDPHGAIEDYRRWGTLAAALAERDPGNPRWRRELANCDSTLGDALADVGSIDQALPAYLESHRLWKALVSEYPKDSDLVHGLAASHGYLGSAYYEQGAYGDALEEFRKQSEIFEHLCGIDPGNGNWCCEYGMTQSWIGNALLGLDDDDGALEAKRRSEKVLLELVDRDRENTYWRRELATAHKAVGMLLYRRGEYEQALSAFAGGRTLIEDLVAGDPTNLRWRADLAGLRIYTGDVFRGQGDRERALELYQDGLDIMRALVERSPTNSPWQNELSASHNRIALLHLEWHDVPAAVSAFREAMNAMRLLVERDRGRIDWQVSLAISQNNLADALKNLPEGRTEAQGLVSRSLELLNRLATLNRLPAHGKDALGVAASLALELRAHAGDASSGQSVGKES